MGTFPLIAAIGGLIVGVAGTCIFVCLLHIIDEVLADDLIARLWGTIDKVRDEVPSPPFVPAVWEQPTAPLSWDGQSTVLPQVRTRSPHLQRVIDHAYTRPRRVR